ncbi:hypothetical protein BJ912DRAFT_199085 [Pholiota molesta]|nr:hypothetical protein BJ912DRAFT_199085 [Pholiota molesta]
MSAELLSQEMPGRTSGHGSSRDGPWDSRDPPPYSPTSHQERTPLLPTTQSHGSIDAVDPLPKVMPATTAILFWVLLLGIVLGYSIQTPLDSAYRQGMQTVWNRTRAAHEQWVSDAKAERNHWDEDQRQRQEQDRLKHEEHERQRHEIQWQGFQRHRCVRYGTREYTATLANVSLGFNAVDECLSKTMRINGRDMRPNHCDDPGYCGKVIGHWKVDFNEPECTPSWGQIADKGCWGSRTRRYDAELLIHISEYESWMDVCATMSAQYGSVYLPPGAQCTRCYGRGCGSGYWATWYIEDWGC